MEDRQYDPNEDKAPALDSEKKRKQGNFLSQFLAKRRGLSLESKESDGDEEDEDSDEKPKKWRRKFRSFFRNNIVAPPEEENKESKKGIFELFKLPLTQEVSRDTPPESIEETVAAQTEHLSLEANPRSDEIVNPDRPIEERAPTVETSMDDPIASEKTFEGPREYMAMSETTPDTASTEPEAPAPEAELPEPETDAIEQEPVRTNSYEGLLTISHPEERIASSEPSVITERETVVERGVGSALPVALVAAEYVGRKRADRKITRNFNEKTNQLQKDAEKSALMQQQLEALVRQNKEQLEALKQDRGILEKPVVAISHEQSAAKSPELRPAASIEEAVNRSAPREKLPPTEVKRPQLRAERVQLTPEENAPRPREIMTQIAQAAERNVPVERVFERSHEVKDDLTARAASAPSVGNVVSSRATYQTGYNFSKEYQQTISQSTDNLPVYVQSDSDMYKQAMKAGFTAAVVIIIFGVIAYLMIK